jgi:DNA-binding response OmpR family regulator
MSKFRPNFPAFCNNSETFVVIIDNTPFQKPILPEGGPAMNPIINRKQDILYKDLAVDLTAHRVSRAGHELLLTPREFALLAVLVTHCDTALSRSQLLEAAWGYAFIGESRTVDVHINRLRRKLGLQNDIQTVYKVGYRLNSAN